MRGSSVTEMFRKLLPGVIVLTLIAAPASAQRGAVGAGQRCEGCDSTARAGAVMRSRDTEIARRTVELANSRIMVEHLRARLAPGSPEAPRSEKERGELQASLVVHRQAMERLDRQLAELCGDATAVRGYLGVDLLVTPNVAQGGGRTLITRSYPIVRRVEPGSPAERAGITVFDTIISINRLDARERSLEPFLREPGEKLTVSVADGEGRRDVTVTVAPKPPSFGGACLQYRNLVFETPSGTSFVTVRPGTAVAGRAGVVRSRSNTSGSGQAATGEGGQRQEVRVRMSPDSAMQTATFIMLPAGAGASALFLSRGATGAIVAGAEVALINGGLKTVFSVEHGALVVNVAPRSPAEQAGILSGDVIVSAQGEPVTAIAVLQRAIQTAGQRKSVALDIVRAKQPKTITLRW
jgi:membrane-associated protease RseP (regulator of RpoE activity)